MPTTLIGVSEPSKMREQHKLTSMLLTLSHSWLRTGLAGRVASLQEPVGSSRGVLAARRQTHRSRVPSDSDFRLLVLPTPLHDSLVTSLDTPCPSCPAANRG